MQPIDNHWRGVRLAARRLRRSPGHSAAVVVNLTLGITAFTGLFAVLYSIVVRPLPYPEPDRLMLVEHEMLGITIEGEPSRFGGFQGQVLHYAQRSRSIEEIGLYEPYDAAIEDEYGPDYVQAGAASAGYFRALGARAEHGRLFENEEPATEQAGGGAILLGRGIWDRRDDADPGVVGTALRMDGIDAEVVGVLAAQGPFPAQPVSLWTPRTDTQIRATPQLLVRGMVVRAIAGVDAAQLQDELDSLIAELPGQIDDSFVLRAVEQGRLRSVVTPLTEVVVGQVAGSLWLLMGAGGLVLLAAMANLTGLQLLRRETQRREVAVRRALGAPRSALARQHLADAALLTATALAAGLAAATALVTWLRASGPQDLPRAAELVVGSEAILVATGVALVAMAWLALMQTVLRADVGQALRGSEANAAGGRTQSRVRSFTAAAELALAVLLLVAAGLVLRSFVALHAVDPGFDGDGVLSFRVPFPFQEIQDAGGIGAATPFYDQLADRLSAYPEISTAGYAQCSPFARTCGPAGLTLRSLDEPPDSGREQRLFRILQSAPGYHETLGIPLLAGRLLERADHEEPTNAVVISEAVAAALWPDDSALGRQITMPDLPGSAPLTVVGVVGEARHSSLRGESEPTVYMPVIFSEQQYELSTVTFVVRTAAPPLTVVDEIRAILAQLRPDIPAANIETLSASLRQSTARLRFAIAILTAAAAAVLILGTTGVYSVIAYAVSLRRSEFGIRLALGADAANLRGLVTRQAAGIAAGGLAAGFLAAAMSSRLLESVLFGVALTDPTTYVSVAGLLGLTAAIACYLPARRAAGTDPAAVLRAE